MAYCGKYRGPTIAPYIGVLIVPAAVSDEYNDKILVKTEDRATSRTYISTHVKLQSISPSKFLS